MTNTNNLLTRKRTRLETSDTNSESNEQSKPSNNSDVIEVKNRSSPPILLREKVDWPKYQRLIADKNIDIRRVTVTQNSVLIYLKKDKAQFSTNQLKQDRDLVVVIRGISEAFTEEVLEELKQNYPAVKQVHRMRKGDRI